MINKETFHYYFRKHYYELINTVKRMRQTSISLNLVTLVAIKNEEKSIVEKGTSREVDGGFLSF